MNDTISRQALLNKFEPWLKVKDYSDGELNMLKAILYEIRFMPPATDKDKVSDLLYHIYSIESPHLDMSGVIAKKYYCEELWKELFGKGSELPGWMN